METRIHAYPRTDLCLLPAKLQLGDFYLCCCSDIGDAISFPFMLVINVISMYMWCNFLSCLWLMCLAVCYIYAMQFPFLLVFNVFAVSMCRPLKKQSFPNWRLKNQDSLSINIRIWYGSYGRNLQTILLTRYVQGFCFRNFLSTFKLMTSCARKSRFLSSVTICSFVCMHIC